mmetsp:Transcript_8282/g.10503  ORF Transcript_8282/g.10503 Transcript_8282/m.10503 type:complete len:169 (-) Transcript_8282:295-801(-)
MTATRAYQSVAKLSFKKRSTTFFDLQQGNTLLFSISASASKPPPQASCLSNLFSDLSVARPKSKRRWGSISSRTQRCPNLVSLGLVGKNHDTASQHQHQNQHQHQPTRLNERKVFTSLTNHQQGKCTQTTEASCCTTSNNCCEKHQKEGGEDNIDSHSWGFFVESEED